MTIRVAHIGTGNAGRIALNHLISDPRFELTGVWVSSDAKVGKDAGELAGLDTSTGIAATNDLDALLATLADGIGADTWREGAGLGLLAWVGFPLVLFSGSVLHERYPWPLAAIHLGDWLLKLLLVAAVVAAWR